MKYPFSSFMPVYCQAWSSFTIKCNFFHIKKNYKYVVTVNGNHVILAQIKNPSGFENMKVYDGDPLYLAADAKIKNSLLGLETNGFHLS